ncbi:MAG: ribonuclease P protein component [Patescibacteria group bacterium]
MALPSKYRLSRSREIKEVFKRGESFDSGLFQIRFIPAALGVKKFAFIVGLKVSKRAVIRNKIKRKINEIIERNISKIKPGYLIAILVKSRAAYEEPKNLEEDLMNNLIKIGRWKK